MAQLKRLWGAAAIPVHLLASIRLIVYARTAAHGLARD
jgi:hypothetical protein